MKELSIEQKAKRFDEVLTMAKECITYVPDDAVNKYMLNMFPELKESEDGKSKKWILEYLHDGLRKSDEQFKGQFNAAISWLEKQGEQSKYWEPSEEQLEALDYAYNSCPDTERGNYYEGVLGTIIDDLHKLSEKQGEQNPAEKVEPKFKTGDWIVTSYGKVNQVIAVDEDGDGFTLDDDTYFSGSWEDMYHLWAIADAKNGDVLVCIGKYGQEIGIIKEYVGKYGGCDKCFETYCFVDWDGIFRTGEYMGSKEIHPATKEQRDTLIKAMADAGWEFDFEKKELRKIEHPKLTEFEDAVKDMMNDYRDAIGDNDATTEEVKERAAYMLSLIPHKPAEWSEEDENLLKLSLENLTELKDRFGKEYGKIGDCIEWLKALKNRVQTQPKQEWSEEDKTKLEESIYLIKSNNTGTFYYEKNELISFLKSLKPQTIWKPSDEHIIAVNTAINVLGKGTLSGKQLIELQEQLKRLKG